jgi:phosphotransferase system  glucose/maltose/N-acetylglucosamine-specific IIC component
MGINALGHVINSAGDFGPMIFGTGERLLLPFGLHHILVALIRFTEAGGTMDVCGHTVSGALTIFQAQLSCPKPTASPKAPPASCRRVKCRHSSAACRVRRWRCTTARVRKTVIKLKAC